MIIASVVLPRPGGPDISTWSGVRPRATAASSISDSCSRTRSWPMSSSRVRGRSAASNARSSGVALARSTESGVDVEVEVVVHRQAFESVRRAARSRVGTSGSAPGSASAATVSTARSASRADQPRPCRASRTWSRQPAAPLTTAVDRRADPVLELDDDPLRALAADAGHGGERGVVLAGDRLAEPVGRQHGEHRLRHLRADTAGGLDAARTCRARRRRRSRTASGSPRGRPWTWRAGPRRRGAGRRACRACRTRGSPLPRRRRRRR